VKITRTGDKFVFHLSRRDQHFFLEVVKLYPRMPSAHHRLSKTAPASEDRGHQQLLEEAMAEQRAENKKLLEELLHDPSRFKETETGGRLSLSPGDLEWLLQVLNDIRVGSWVRLGSPEPRLELAELNHLTAADFWAMELSGYFQMHFLEAIKGKG
jgi:hypothetical protein